MSQTPNPYGQQDPQQPWYQQPYQGPPQDPYVQQGPPQWGPTGAPPQPPAKPKTGVGKVLAIIGGIALAFFVLLAGCGALLGALGDDSDSSDSASEPGTVTASEEPATEEATTEPTTEEPTTEEVWSFDPTDAQVDSYLAAMADAKAAYFDEVGQGDFEAVAMAGAEGICTDLSTGEGLDARLETAIETSPDIGGMFFVTTVDAATRSVCQEFEQQGRDFIADSGFEVYQKPDLSVEQESAIQKAESYLEHLPGWSREGLIGQVEYEGFPSDVAEFAVDYLDIDYMEQAELKAESYMENVGGFSYDSLVDQLLFEKFTQEQAEHGADHIFG